MCALVRAQWDQRRLHCGAWIAAFALGMLQAPARGDEPARTDDDPNVIESFDVAGNGDLLLIPVSMDGREYQFVLDTGSAGNGFDSQIASALKPTGRTARVNGVKHSMVDGSRATVGRAGWPVSGNSAAIDLGPVCAGLGCHFDGVLGMPFLEGKIVRIDFDSGRLSFLRASDSIKGTIVKLQQRGRPTICGDLPGIPNAPFLIDTGNKVFTNGSLSTRTLDKLIRTGRATVIDTVVTQGVGWERSQRVVSVNSFALAGFTHEAQSFGEGSQNTLGLGYLSRYTVTLDFPGQRLILAKGKQHDRKFPRNSAGLYLALTERGLEVAAAQEGRTAHSCGVRQGDVILEVDGESMRGKSAYDVTRALREHQEGAALTLARAGSPAPLMIRLRAATGSVREERR